MNPLQRWCLAALGLAGMALPLLRGDGGQAQPVRESALEERLQEPEQGNPLREECFALEELPVRAAVEALSPLPDGALAAWGDGSAKLVGLVRCRRLGLEAGQQIEWDVHFREEQLRVLHVEVLTPGATQLVWRELRSGAGRTLTARRSEDGAALWVRDWSGREPYQGQIAAAQDVLMPLQLLELLRAGAVLKGPVHTLDPLSRSIETLVLSETPAEGGARRIELMREDGTLAARWLLDGEQLLAFQWQGGHLRARLIPAEEHERLLADEVPAPER